MRRASPACFQRFVSSTGWVRGVPAPRDGCLSDAGYAISLSLKVLHGMVDGDGTGAEKDDEKGWQDKEDKGKQHFDWKRSRQLTD